jgi:VCBS repeat-containing protein
VSGTTLTPATNFNGTLTVPVKVNDGGLDSNVFNLTVTVTAVNDVPVATAGTLTTLEDTVGNGTVSGTDIENSPLTYTVVTNGTQGTVVITNASTGAYTYTPNTNLNGSDSFTFKANDGTVDSTPATVTVTITPVNDLPTFTATNPPAVLENTGTHTLPNWATFTPGPVDETDNVLTYTVSNVSNPTLFASLPSVNTSGTLTYTLATNQSGTSTIDVTVQDTGGTANGGNDLSTSTQFTLQTNAPELQVRQNTTVQAHGSVYDFGPILITQSSPVITFTIDNLGTSDLFHTGSPQLAITGEAAAEFLVTYPTLDTLIPGAFTTFTVTFIPTVMGTRTATLTLVNNDSDETTNTLILQGQGLTPNVKISLGSADIPMGGSLDLGLVSVGHLVSYPVTIENIGNSDLRLLGDPSITINGLNAVEFNIDDTATATVLHEGEQTSFMLNFQPLTVGPKTVTVILTNNDLEQGNYPFTVTAAGGLQKDLQITVAGTGQGTVTSNLPNLTCLGDFCQQPVIDAPQWVRLKPVPAEGSAFTGWSGDPACQADGKVFVTDHTICQATFELQSYEFTVGRLGHGRITGPGIDCPSDCTETLLYGTEIQLAAVADREWTHTGWKGSCDTTGKATVAKAQTCRALFEPLLEGPNVGDGNGDGIPDAAQPHVISLPDKVSGQYVTFEVQPETCPITDVYTDVPDNYGKPDKNKPLPQGLIYFDLGCSQAQISVYYHAVSVVRRNFVFQKYGPTVPGDENTIGWFTLPNVTFEAVMVGGKSVVKATYTVTDGGLGDSTGVDGRIVDPGGLGLQ